MARNRYIFKYFKDDQYVSDKSKKWFKAQDYKLAEFKKGYFRLVPGSSGSSINYSLKERPGYRTYYRLSFASSLLVFEVKIESNEIAFECYSPLLLFGIVRYELTFIEKASWITQYRKEGYKDMIAFKDFLGLERDELA